MKEVNQIFLEQLDNIKENGFTKSTRACWKNGEKAKTIGIFQSIQKYCDIKNNFPILSLRNINHKAAIDEILWIFQKRSNKLNELNSKIWNSWNFKNTGTIGNSYGYILNKKYKGLNNNHPEIFGNKENLNLVEYLFQQICDNPNDRRIIVSLYDFEELNNTNLPPCAFETLWSVEKNKLHMSLIQRSGDFFPAASAGGWNEVQYGFLQCLVAQCCGLEPGNFLHLVQDLHIYDKHLIENKEKIEKWLKEKNDNFEPVILKISEKINNPERNLKKAWELFENFKLEDYILENYNPKNIKLKLEIAI